MSCVGVEKMRTTYTKTLVSVTDEVSMWRRIDKQVNLQFTQNISDNVSRWTEELYLKT